MPIYEYQCPKCGQKTETLDFHFIAIPPNCHRCGSLMGRITSAPAIRLKGSGWQTPSPKDSESPKDVLS